jgi:hypothetical protein
MVTDIPSISPPAAISLCFVGVLYGERSCTELVGLGTEEKLPFAGMHLIVFPAAIYTLL